MSQPLPPAAYDVIDETTGPPAEPIDAPVLQGPLAGMSLTRQMLYLSIWPFFGALLNFFISSFDTALAGRLSVEATNATAIAAYFGWLIAMVYMAVGTGTAAIVARAIGAGRTREANVALGQSILLAAVSGVVVGAMVVFTADWVARFMGLEGESHRLCVIYLQIMGLSAPLSGMLHVGGAALRAAGDTRTPFYVLLVGNAVNVPMSLLFVYGPEPIGGWGVGGIAVGTACAWLVGCVLTLWVLGRGVSSLKLRWVRLRPRKRMMNRLLWVGLPSFVEMFLGMWVANFLILKMLSYLDDPAAWGAHVIAIRIEGLSYLPGYAVGLAAATLAGQYLGVGDTARARRGVLLCWLCGAAMMALMGVVFIVFAEPMVRIYTNQPDLLEAAPPLLRMCGYVQFFFASAMILSNALRGAGDTRMTMILTSLSIYGVRVPLAWYFGVVLGYGLYGIWIGLCAELVVRGLLFMGRYLQGGWLRLRV